MIPPSFLFVFLVFPRLKGLCVHMVFILFRQFLCTLCLYRDLKKRKIKPSLKRFHKASNSLSGTPQNKIDQLYILPLNWSCSPSCRLPLVLAQRWATASVRLAMEVRSEERPDSSWEGCDLHRAVRASLAESMSALCCCTTLCRSCKWRAVRKTEPRRYARLSLRLHCGGKGRDGERVSNLFFMRIFNVCSKEIDGSKMRIQT